MTGLSTVGFVLGAIEDEPDRVTLTPHIDGQSLVDLVGRYENERGFDAAGGYDGIVPSAYRYGDLVAYLLGGSADNDRQYLLGCDCGEVGCWPLTASINSDPQTVTWSAFMQPHRRHRDYSDLGPFVFDRSQYERALRAAAGAFD